MWSCGDVTDEPSTLLPVEPKAMLSLCTQIPAVRMSTPGNHKRGRGGRPGMSIAFALSECVGRAH